MSTFELWMEAVDGEVEFLTGNELCADDYPEALWVTLYHRGLKPKQAAQIAVMDN